MIVLTIGLLSEGIHEKILIEVLKEVQQLSQKVCLLGLALPRVATKSYLDPSAFNFSRTSRAMGCSSSLGTVPLLMLSMPEIRL